MPSEKVPGFFSYTPQEIRRSLANTGLAASGAHCLPLSLSDEAARRQMDLCAAIGIPRVITALPAARPDQAGRPAPIARVFQGMSEADLRWSADRMNTLGRMARANGQAYGYHTHNLDFRPVAGSPVLDWLMRLTDASSVAIELDLGNLIAAGADPLQWLRLCRPRLIAVHLKDWAPGFTPSFELKFPRPAPFGAGVTDWRRLLAALAQAKVGDLIVEQEVTPGSDALEAQAQALRYLRALVGEPPRER